MKKIIIGFLLCLLFPITQLASDVWTINGIQDYIWVTAVETNGSTIYAGTFSCGLFISTNDGTDWRSINSGLTNPNISSILLNGSDIYVSTDFWNGIINGGVFKSTNGGTTWVSASAGLEIPGSTNIAITDLKKSNNNLYASAYGVDYNNIQTFGGVFISTNNGGNWSYIGLNGRQVNTLAVDGPNIYAGTSDGLYFSNDNGTNWSNISLNHWIYSLLIEGGNLYAGTWNSGMYKTTDNGGLWTQLSIQSSSIYKLAADGNNIYAGGDNGVNLSADGGTTWTQLNSGFDGNQNKALALNSNYIFTCIANNVGFLRSPKNIPNWEPLSCGLKQQPVYSILNGNDILTGTWEGIFKTTNEGKSWTDISSDITNKHIVCLAGNGNNIYAGTYNYEQPGNVFYTSNNGANWIPIGSGLQGSSIMCIAIDGNYIYAGTASDGIYLTTDNGTNWSPVNNGLTDSYILCITIEGSNIYCGTDHGIFMSTDNGTNWSSISNGIPDTYIFTIIVKGTKIFAGTYGYLAYVSSDNGASWNPSNNGFTYQGRTYTNINWLATDGNNIYAGASLDYYGGIMFMSTDDGNSWIEANDGLINLDTYGFLINGSTAYTTTSLGIFKNKLPSSAYWYVATNGNNTTGKSWADAFTSFQSALDIAVSGDKILVARGIYKPSNDYGIGIGSRYYHFRMIDGVLIYGGFAGNEPQDYDLSLRDFESNETILSGDLNSDDAITGSGATLSISNNGENCYHVFYHPEGLGLSNSAVLDGFIISGGNSISGGDFHDFGGGMINLYQSNPTIMNCSFINNSAEYGGGMVNFTQSNPTITNCEFVSNSADVGGGIFNYEQCNPTITNCEFVNNSADGGGGMSNFSSNPTITNCEFVSNSADVGGGMVNGNQCNPTITNCEFISNSARVVGGMLNQNYCNPVITNSSFLNNSAENFGGILNEDHCSPMITNSTFISNSSTWIGGGIANLYQSNSTITNCTFHGNSASGYGGGIFVMESHVVINNSIFWGNIAGTGNQIYISDGTTTLNYSCFANGINDIYGTISESNCINSDPIFLGNGEYPYSLAVNSPCINTGFNDYNTTPTDIRGEARIQDDIIDMGAYENQTEFTTDGTLWSWGLNWHGGIGHGTTSDVFLSPQQLDATTDWATVSCGNYHTLAIKSDGTLWAWGQNNHGQLGDGTTIERLSPVQIGDDNQWVSLSASMFNSAAIKQDGTIWTWGWNLCGQIGNGITDDQLTPNKVNDETDWASISCGNAHMLALKTNGQLWGWGWNQYGELGIEGTSGELLPRQIGTDWAFISAGGQFSIAIKTNGTLWAWGYNNYGQLGYVTPNVRQYIPQQIDNATDWAYICSGMYHAVAIKTNGSLWAWGYNGQGRLGDGTTTDRNTPVPIGSSNNWASLSCDENTMALKTDGTIWIWGQNGYGQIGGGSTDIQLTPVQIGPDNTWSVISAGSYHFAGLKNSSTIVLPTITTTPPSAITHNSAQSGGNITSDGGSPVTERGVCWNKTGDPIITDNHTSDGTGLGIFTSNLSGLNPGTHYYVRAYATNSAGAAYGNELEFTTSSPKIIYVKYDATGSNNGTSWTNAFTSFQSALDVAVSGKQIWAARGTYYPSSDYSLNIGERGKHFRMINDVTIYGGFEGIEPEDYDLSQRNFETNEAILSGDIGTAGDNSDNCCHVFFHPEGLGLTSSAILDGFTISGGNANLTSNLLYSGGGMANYSNSPSLTNCNFSSNSAMDGGGMYNRDQCNPIITNCIFTSNAAENGGGMYNSVQSDAIITNCTFTSNTVYSQGGGILNLGSNSLITNCEFNDNSANADGGGGGMFNQNCDPTISNSSFTSNSARTGGGLMNFHQCNPIITNCIFTSNAASYDGGAMYNFPQCNPTITNCVFNNNSASNDGGGVVLRDHCSPAITNCIITNNSSSHIGGGIVVREYSDPIIWNCTISSNTSSSIGGGICIIYNSNPIINNSIFWGNTSLIGQGNQLFISTGLTTLNNSCFANGTNDVIGTITTSNCINSNPKFVGTGSYPYSLLGYSPCINAGNNSYNSTETDIRGQARIQDGTIDMGAYENQFMPDNIPPVAICKNKEVTLVNGSATINASDIDNGSYDNDEIASMTVSQSVFTCSDIGENTVTLTVTDVSGNSSTCNATVTVIGTIPSVSIAVSPSPTIDPGGDANTIYLGYGPQSVTLTASGGVSYEWSSNPVGFISTSPNPTVSPTVTTDYTVIATNQYGCSASHTVTIYVENVQSGNNDNQILICVKGKTKRVAANAVSAQLKNGAYLGECKGSAKSSEEIFDDNEMNSYQEEEVAVKLKQNYPNPFAGLTELQYFVSKKEHVTLVLTDVSGRVVANLVDRYVNGGWNTLIVNGSGLTAGVYILRLESLGKAAMMKIVKAD